MIRALEEFMADRVTVSSLIQASKSLIERLRTNPGSPEGEKCFTNGNKRLDFGSKREEDDFDDEKSRNSELTLKIVNEILNSKANNSQNVVDKLDFK